MRCSPVILTDAYLHDEELVCGLGGDVAQEIPDSGDILGVLASAMILEFLLIIRGLLGVLTAEHLYRDDFVRSRDTLHDY